MIKLKKLQVKNFKSLIKTEIETFGEINFFYGFNNSGKSNIFKFLKILFERKKAATKVNYKPDEDSSKLAGDSLINTLNFWSGSILNQPFLFTKNNREVPITFEIELTVDNNILPDQANLKKNKLLGKKLTDVLFKGKITSIDLETSFLQIEEGFLNSKRFFRHEDEVDYFFEEFKIDKKIGENILPLFDDLILLIDSDRNFVQEISNSEIDGLFEPKDFKKSLFDLYIKAEKNEAFNKLGTFLSEFEFSDEAKEKLKSNINSFPFNENTDIGFAIFDKEIEIMLKNNSLKLPLKNYGTGIQQFLFLLAKIHFNKAKVVIIEELELNLSPLYQKELLRFLKSLIPNLYSQLLFSSHSPYFAQKGINLLDVIHFVQIDYTESGGSHVDSHDDMETFELLAENGFFYFD